MNRPKTKRDEHIQAKNTEQMGKKAEHLNVRNYVQITILAEQMATKGHACAKQICPVAVDAAHKTKKGC